MTEKKQYREYLGDAVYAWFDGFHIWLETENWVTVTNQIALEPGVYHNLELYRKWLSIQLTQEKILEEHNRANSPTEEKRTENDEEI